MLSSSRVKAIQDAQVLVVGSVVVVEMHGSWTIHICINVVHREAFAEPFVSADEPFGTLSSTITASFSRRMPCLGTDLSHGFIGMLRLIIIFDKLKLQPSLNIIISSHYHPYLTKHGQESAPRISGLTTSPTIKSKTNEGTLKLSLPSNSVPVFIEGLLWNDQSNLDAVTWTPQDLRTQRNGMSENHI